jgi:hypothetical protein
VRKVRDYLESEKDVVGGARGDLWRAGWDDRIAKDVEDLWALVADLTAGLAWVSRRLAVLDARMNDLMERRFGDADENV